MTRTGYDYDAVVVGSGPNGLAAAIRLAQAGCSVLVLEGKDTIGGGLRSAEVTLPGFVHDICAAVLSMGGASPYLRTLPLAEHGVSWVLPDIPVAQPFDDGTAAVLYRSVGETAAGLGRDGAAWRRMYSPFVTRWQQFAPGLLGPRPTVRHLALFAHFARYALFSASGLARQMFRAEPARALFAGLAAHAIRPLESVSTAAFGMVLGTTAHVTGWPFARGGSQMVANALAAILRTLGGEIVTGHLVQTMADIPPARAVLFDVTPRQLVQIAGERLPAGYRRQLARFRYGHAAFKVDYALSGPVPWRNPDCRRAGTLHLGGTLAEMATSERVIWQGQPPEQPYVIAVQSSVFDPSRAPKGQHTLWAYCHVPHGSTVDMTARIDAQIERFAPGFRDLILARSVRTAPDMELYNPNYIGGDINGGVQDLQQQWTRPTPRWNPYTTPVKGIYICSSSTPPGGGVHGMCGYHAAQAALHDLGRRP